MFLVCGGWVAHIGWAVQSCLCPAVVPRCFGCLWQARRSVVVVAVGPPWCLSLSAVDCPESPRWRSCWRALVTVVVRGWRACCVWVPPPAGSCCGVPDRACGCSPLAVWCPGIGCIPHCPSLASGGWLIFPPRRVVSGSFHRPYHLNAVYFFNEEG